MTENPIPQAAIELFPESLQLSPKQRIVLDALQDFPNGARAIDIAEDLGMHINTVRGHLEELIAQDAIRVEKAQAHGRGRPFLIFRTRSPNNRTIATEYIALIESMATLLDASNATDLKNVATDIAKHWAKTMNIANNPSQNFDELLPLLMIKLRTMGFDPDMALKSSVGAKITLNSCPFIASQKRPAALICAIHEGLIQEILGNTAQVTLAPFNAPGSCAAQLTVKTYS